MCVTRARISTKQVSKLLIMSSQQLLRDFIYNTGMSVDMSHI